jgi:PPOX class probable F420-dependent enzyme
LTGSPIQARFYVLLGGGSVAGTKRFEEAGMATTTAAKLTDSAKNILSKQAFGHLATSMPDGSPQVTPVWVDYEGDFVVINTAEGRAKPRNMRNDPRVALSATDPDNPYEAVIIRGRVSEMTDEGADEHIDAMAKKYLGKDSYPFRQAGEQRVKVFIQPESVKGANG